MQRIRTDRGFGGKPGLASWVDRNYQEFTFKAEYAYDYGMPQWLAGLDHFFSPLKLERLFLGRHKVYHYRVWYRDGLANYVQEMLLDSRTLSRPYLERKGVEADCPRSSQGQPQLHDRDSPASLPGTDPPAFLGRLIITLGYGEDASQRV